MADLPAAEGSFEWAMLELKSGKRVSREAWKDRNMYLVLNPGEPGQTVKDGDWRALAGVPVDTQFDYLPNIEICNAEGNFVPYQPSQVDMEMKDWGELANSSEYDLVVDITNGYWYRNTDNPSQTHYWGFTELTDWEFGECNIINNGTTGNAVFYFHYSKNRDNKEEVVIGLNCEESGYDALVTLMDKTLTIMVDDTPFKLGKGGGGSVVGHDCHRSYNLQKNSGLSDKFTKEKQIHRFYCKWAD
ncbi:DUF2829 domain-containing protein [Pluralibacter gergoviae]|uniref:DUF2829 domain-containing protein n=1 Tax=Pluralibacter gergoviae TaxID=61647 RepID=UPI0004F6AFBB|nr:DUF2829 domain-containing protein [Pluralibacter gergoviae]AIQ99733.1 hypothetical protein LG71_07435 [Pluralibacter gergoviae]EKW6617190.1 DUF2829 domain-containing protein [Pluralibacter gergoviae]EKW9968312.1 DUF2829 domain-containing protein [Pluralibacter gergoviae]OHY67462.1 hypothetical protein BB778_15385 [Pluralibacter gergoviae]